MNMLDSSESLRTGILNDKPEIKGKIINFNFFYNRNMKTNVRSYTDREILDRVKSHARGFVDYPDGYWLIGIRSKEDEFNKFDDKFYLFYNKSFVAVYSGTTNPGSKGLKEYRDYNPDGAGILQSDRIVYDGYIRGESKGREVYRQFKPFPYYRDGDMDTLSEELGEVRLEVIHAHIHDAKMNGEDVDREDINGWSLACQAFNNGLGWDQFMKLTEKQSLLTYCILKEF